MKIQHLAVIFVIIIMPISLVMTQYIQNQIDTINLQTTYTKNLNSATHDALKAFQLNTVNNKYSSLSDSKIRDIEASINTFYNSLGASMEINVSSKDELATFVPAILFTLYDGYYIHSSYNNIYSTIGEDTNERVQIKDPATTNNYQDGLRPYIYYSCEYKLPSGNKVIVNYTLDNAITVYGDFGEGYETKSGYLINPKDVKNINTRTKTLEYKGVRIEPETLVEHLITVNNDETISQGDYPYIVYNNQKVYRDTDGTYFWYSNYKKTPLQSQREKLEQYLAENGVGFKSISAFEYYQTAYDFSIWANQKLRTITQANIIQNDRTEGAYKRDGDLYLSVNTEGKSIFDTTAAGNDPMLSESVFNAHRMAVIRKSIETNLTTAIANYNIQSQSNYEFVMPIINEENWGKIANNVSIISFMQGMPIGQKYYNNYSVITNTKNEEVINSQSVYVLATDGSNNLEYHQPGCKELIENSKNGTINIQGVYTHLSFLRQTVKVTEANIQYFYPQSRVGRTTTGCYNCIVNASVDYDIDDIIEGTIKDYLTGNIIYNSGELVNVRKAYLTGLARERFDLYKSNF